MKKKSILVVSIIMVATIICACLVGCAPTRPDKFLIKWTESKSKAIITDEMDDMQMLFAVDGNKIMVKASNEFEGELIQIFEKTSNKVNMYRYNGISKEWVAESMTEEDANEYPYYKGFKDGINIPEEQKKQMIDEFEKNFEKKDGLWTMKGAEGNGMSMQVDGNDLVMQMKIGEKSKELARFIMNYKISIPKEAKDALK